jgi:alcohol dehydrogenase (cytochrome c)
MKIAGNKLSDRHSSKVLGAVAGTLCLFTGATLWAQPGAREGFNGVDARRGAELYRDNCGQCHGMQREGVTAPALRGTTFSGVWHSAGELNEFIAASMPPSAPGSLGKEAYRDIAAYLLQSSTDVPGQAAGTTKLPQAITFGHPLPGAEGVAEVSKGSANVDILKALQLPPRKADQEKFRNYHPITDAMILYPSAGDWLTWRGTVDNNGYSPLKQINRSNVKHLELVWAWPMATLGQQQTTPLVHDGIMFIATNNNVVEALNAQTGDLIWEYRHSMTEFAPSAGYQKIQPIRQKNSISLYGDKVILATADAKLVALDAKSGAVAWTKQVLDPKLGYGYTTGPIVINGKIISGISGCSITGTAGGCYIMAHDVTDGRELWRFNTIANPNDPALEASWRGVPSTNRWGGALWITGAYDPETDLTYWGVGAPGPYSELIRGTRDGEVLYTNSTVALNATTGKIVWSYSHLPRDNWDMDSPFERMLIDVDKRGKKERLLVTVAGKDGIAFGLDRVTGQYRWSRETVFQNIVKNVDPTTGKVAINTDLIQQKVGKKALVCPSGSGGKLWQAAAYSPLTKDIYVPLAESCNEVTPIVTEFTEGNTVASTRFGPRVLPKDIKDAGLLVALQVEDGEPRWRHTQRATFTSSVLTTGGHLLVVGDAARYLKIFDQDTGKLLWETRLNAPIGGSPITYEVAGVQYLAVPTGFSTQALTSAPLFPEIAVPSGSGNSLFVFRLPQAAKH